MALAIRGKLQGDFWQFEAWIVKQCPEMDIVVYRYVSHFTIWLFYPETIKT
jgi:hypothetical protein